MGNDGTAWHGHKNGIVTQMKRSSIVPWIENVNSGSWVSLFITFFKWVENFLIKDETRWTLSTTMRADTAACPLSFPNRKEYDKWAIYGAGMIGMKIYSLSDSRLHAYVTAIHLFKSSLYLALILNWKHWNCLNLAIYHYYWFLEVLWIWEVIFVVFVGNKLCLYDKTLQR